MPTRCIVHTLRDMHHIQTDNRLGYKSRKVQIFLVFYKQKKTSLLIHLINKASIQIVASQKPIALFTLFFLTINLAGAQNKKWTTEISKIRNTEVKSLISDQPGPGGEAVQTIEYIATAEVEANFESCIKVMKNTALHKKIFDYTAKTEMLEKESESEWYNYYYTDMPWPLPNSDSVTRFLFSNDGQTATFVSTASPNKIGRKDVKRILLYNTNYIFTKLDNGKIKITLKSKFQPVSSLPTWMANLWFPDGPARMIDRIISLSKNEG